MDLDSLWIQQTPQTQSRGGNRAECYLTNETEWQSLPSSWYCTGQTSVLYHWQHWFSEGTHDGRKTFHGAGMAIYQIWWHQNGSQVHIKQYSICMGKTILLRVHYSYLWFFMRQHSFCFLFSSMFRFENTGNEMQTVKDLPETVTATLNYPKPPSKPERPAYPTCDLFLPARRFCMVAWTYFDENCHRGEC